MWEILVNMFETFVNNLIAMNKMEMSLLTLWVSFAAYASWYFTSAKHHVPLTGKEVRLLWKIHKNNTQCKSRKWHEIRCRDEIVGFKCECGYKHVQKRPVV